MSDSLSQSFVCTGERLRGGSWKHSSFPVTWPPSPVQPTVLRSSRYRSTSGRVRWQASFPG